MKLFNGTMRVAFFAFILTAFAHNSFWVPSVIGDAGQNSSAVTAQNSTEPDIQWFKKEMKIDPKYTEKREGVLGMSWAHFFTMIFLVIFCFIAVIAHHQRTTRTTRILEKLLKED